MATERKIEGRPQRRKEAKEVRRHSRFFRTLFAVFLTCLVTSVHAGAIDKLHRFLETTKTLRADFAQIVVAKHGKRPQQSAGVMMVSRPGKFRWQIDKPYSQLLVGDGEKIWMYDPDLRQVTVKIGRASCRERV